MDAQYHVYLAEYHGFLYLVQHSVGFQEPPHGLGDVLGHRQRRCMCAYENGDLCIHIYAYTHARTYVNDSAMTLQDREIRFSFGSTLTMSCWFRRVSTLSTLALALISAFTANVSPLETAAPSVVELFIGHWCTSALQAIRLLMALALPFLEAT